MLKRVLAILLFAGFPAVPVLADIRDDFRRPEAFEPDIAFWSRIYTEVGTEGGLLHDRQHLDVVYETVEFPEDASPRERSRHVDERRQSIRRQLLELARNPQAEGESAQAIRELWGERGSVAVYRAAADRIRFQLGQRNRFRAGLARSGRWDAHIREVMREHDVPEGMVALPHVESSFTPHARSRVGAAGMWQFTRGAAERFMQVDHVVDERLDPWRASEAAARLLRYNREVTGSWELALTAYNHGAAGVRRAVEIVGTDDIVRIAREYQGRRFGFASRNFYPAFLAALDIHAEPDLYFPDLEIEPPAKPPALSMPAYMPVEAVVDALDVAPESLRRLNPALLQPVWEGRKYIPRGYELRLPASFDRQEAERQLAAVPSDRRFARQQPDRYHVLQPGETLSYVAQHYGVSVSRLVQLNNLRSPNRVRAGQRLTLPGGEAEGVAAERMPEDGVYEVRPGDNLSLIAERFNTTAHRLVRLNDLGDSDRIYPGQSLRVAAVDGTADTTMVAEEDTEAPEEEAKETDTEAVADASAGGGLSEEAGDGVETVEVGPVAAPLETLPEDQPQLAADPSDYAVAPDGRITMQWEETLGHHAEWLEIRTQRLRELNDLRFGESVSAGQDLALDFSQVEPGTYEQRRLTYHEGIQSRFFRQYRLVGTEDYTVSRGDSIWRIARRFGDLPEWLIQQYNPDQPMSRIRPGDPLRIPKVEERP